MADKKPEPHGYHPITDNDWVMSVSAETVQEMLIHARSATVERKDSPARLTSGQLAILENSRDFLTRAARGFVVEFLRHTADHIVDLNMDSQASEAEIRKNAAPGLFHATACAKGLMQRGMDIDSACYAMGIVIRHSLDTFTSRYNDHEELYTNADAMGSVVDRADLIRAELKKYAQNYKTSAKTPNA